MLDLYPLIRPVLRRLPAEAAHRLTVRALEAGLGRFVCTDAAQEADPPILAQRLWGLDFSNPVGLAAGFDKDARVIEPMQQFGFGFVEIGTVTPRPQPGNPKPRLFRLDEDEAIINRMGFNSTGLDAAIDRLERRPRGGIVGVNLGKNRESGDAVADYAKGIRRATKVADYLVVNVSSPNTERLRELQARDGLQRILGALLEERLTLQQRFTRRVPLLIKVAPDLSPEQVCALADEVRSVQLDGVIATNTSTDLSVLKPPPSAQQRGGLSGAPLHPVSIRIISQLRAELGADFPIVGVGGIVSAEHARASLRAGANLLQIYTGFAYRGAALIEEILRALPA